MQRLLDEHFFNLTTGSTPDVEEEEEETYTAPTPKKAAPSETSSESDLDESTDDKLKKLLADL
jgi:hypothetical protein